jgi:murein lipoprotein
MVGHYRKLVLIPIALLGLAGCATTSDLDALRAEVRQANETAQSALARAEAAEKQAAAASGEAAAAMQTAEEARAMATETDSKIDRMFKKSMYK